MSEKRFVVETTHSKNKIFDEDRIDFLKSILYKAQVGIKLLLHVISSMHLSIMASLCSI